MLVDGAYVGACVGCPDGLRVVGRGVGYSDGIRVAGHRDGSEVGT